MESVLINSTFLLKRLKDRNCEGVTDASRHILCPGCTSRSRQYLLSDGRRKCKRCHCKFSHCPKDIDVRIRRIADVILCFCLDFSALQASRLCGYRYRFVWEIYRQLRLRIAAESLASARIPLLLKAMDVQVASDVNGSIIHSHIKIAPPVDETLLGRPVIGIRRLASGAIFLEALPLSDAVKKMLGRGHTCEESLKRFQGFIVRGRLVRPTRKPNAKSEVEGMETFWSWAKRKLAKHHGVHKKTLMLYFKELEWKFNNHKLTPQALALKLVDMLPPQFMRTWSRK